MVDLLIREGVGNNPIVWVGHSKGGLYVKQMLVDGTCVSCDIQPPSPPPKLKKSNNFFFLFF